MAPFGEVLAVTDDYAERDTVAYHGGMASSCANFIETVEMALEEQAHDISRQNRKERAGFKAPR
jgi:predicted RNA-binding protein with PIN domain